MVGFPQTPYCNHSTLYSPPLPHTTHYTPQRVLPYRKEASPPSLLFGQLASLSAVQAIPLPALGMVLVLEQNGDLILYSGTLAVVEVVGVRDAVGHHFMMELSSGATLRCHLPPLYPHPTGSMLYVYTHW